MPIALSPGGRWVLEAVRRLAALVLSADDEYSIREALEAGARGYVTNRAASDALARAVREISARRSFEPGPRAQGA